MPHQSVKERILLAFEALPDDATFEEAMDLVRVLAKVHLGLEKADAGDPLTYEEPQERILR